MKKSLKPLPKMASAALCAQMVRCGKRNCKCSRGDLHGPYYYLFTRIAGVLTKRYVKAEDVLVFRRAYNVRRANERRTRATAQLNKKNWQTFRETLREAETLVRSGRIRNA
jgi:hypothetical protein